MPAVKYQLLHPYIVYGDDDRVQFLGLDILRI